jgi:hypothetical protein
MRIASAVVGMLWGGVAVGSSQVRNAELGYTLTLPAGFQEYPEGRSQKAVVDCWTETTPVSAHGGIILFVQRMHGVLPRERMRQEDLPATTHLVTLKWKGFDIDGLSTRTSKDNVPVFVLASQVPLRREAVQLVVSGPADQEARAQEMMTAMLATLDGETNWLTPAERAARLGRIAGGWIAIGLAVVAVLWWRKRRRAHSP